VAGTADQSFRDYDSQREVGRRGMGVVYFLASRTS
jgi:hypothetical protein